MSSEWAQSIGYCSGDTAAAARIVNRAQERLLTCREAGDTGWYGCYAEMAFDIDTTNPYVTMPRGVARLIRLAVNDCPVPIRNQFHEYMEFGSGRWPKLCQSSGTTVCSSGQVQMLRRNLVPTMTPLTTPGYTLRFTSDVADNGKQVVVTCKDSNDQLVRTLHNGVKTNGIFVTLAAPSVDLILPDTTAQFEISEIIGLQKDVTLYPVGIYEVNIATADTNLLLTM